MILTFLGHAGFLLETEEAIIVADPWFSNEGAFDSSWFQLPRNHHLAPLVREKLSDGSKERFVYVSHEHRDHFDPVFLASLPTSEITAVLPYFSRSALRDQIGGLGWGRLFVTRDGGEVPVPGGYIRLFVSDTAMNRDSSLFVRMGGHSFLDLNDCKIHDRLEAISREEGPITVFTAQFSGAIWHPVRYDYDPKTFDTLSRKKMFSKFEAVARAIQTLTPSYFLASAGPACFLDPELIHENFRKASIFPRAPQFFGFLGKRLGNVATRLLEPMPGDTLDVSRGAYEERGEIRLNHDDFESFVRDYAESAAPLFQARRRNLSQAEAAGILERMEGHLRDKLDRLILRDRIDMPLYVRIAEVPEQTLEVRFDENRIERVAAIPPENRHVFETSAGDVKKVLDRQLTWDEFLLSLRFRMSRRPDRYDPILHGFLVMEVEDIAGFCAGILEAESKQERTTVLAGERRYSIHRYCPHQGADLTQGWVEEGRFLVCPRHRWRFDLADGGKCTFNNSCIHATEEREERVALPEAARATEEQTLSLELSAPAE